ncbi:hypothetical protein O181_098666 [Austropuccinia psidii MF-1]|uniref:Uncharacterized protein n=1 Tax=Austropuccinia psidii MF-1 TaxID=1389203 RepID=A0A9Q3PG60_9BASI|nr:hypothetical protein [Austropuccinia psidii MF-1]
MNFQDDSNNSHFIDQNTQPDLSQILQTQNQFIIDLKNQLQCRDQEVKTLMAKVENLQVKVSQASEKSSKKSKEKTNKKKATIQQNDPATSASKAKRGQSPSQKKLTSGSKRPVFTPSKTNKTRPNQLNMKDTPEGFKPTKNAFYAHIRIIWGLIYEKLVPIGPKPSLLKDLNNHFDYVDEIQQVTNSSNAVALIPETDVITLRGTKPGRKKLCKTHYKFGVAENFPKRYLKVLAEIDSHSDDEFDEKENGYIIKLLPYRSQNSTTFMHRVDEEIEKASRNQRGKSQKHRRIISKAALPTNLGRPPKGLPINFFDHQWFNNCSPAQKTIHSDTMRDSSHEIPIDEDDNESNSEDEDIEIDSSSDIDRESNEENEEENINLDSDEEMEDKSQAAGHFSNAEYGFEWENWQ